MAKTRLSMGAWAFIVAVMVLLISMTSSALTFLALRDVRKLASQHRTAAEPSIRHIDSLATRFCHGQTQNNEFIRKIALRVGAAPADLPPPVKGSCANP